MSKTIDDDIRDKLRALPRTNRLDPRYPIDAYEDDLVALIARERQQEAKAYGGCTKCYGKGYATINDRWIAHDTDQDIGSPGGTVVGGKDFAIKYCTCGRGKQFEAVVARERQEAADEAANHLYTASQVRDAVIAERKELRWLFDNLRMVFGASAGSSTGVTVRNDFGEEFDFQLDREALRELLGRFNMREVASPLKNKRSSYERD